MDPHARRAALAAGVALLTSTAAPQEFGQWSWEGSARFGQRVYENLLDGAGASTYDERGIDLSLGVRGFIVHPALGRFTLGVQDSLSRYGQRLYPSTRRLGLNADVALVPEGSYPLRLFARRQAYDYASLDAEDPLTRLGLPDSSTTWGGRLSFRGGRLTGTFLGFERTTLDLLDPTAVSQLQERAFADWSRAGRRLQHHYRLERRLQDYGGLAFRTDDLTGTVDEHGHISTMWRWDLSGTGIRRDFSYRGAASRVDTLGLRNSFVRSVKARDALTLSYDAGVLHGSGGATTQSHDLSARYRWRPREHWEVTPSAGYGLQSSDGTGLSAPRLGVGLGWYRQGHRVDAALNGSGSYGTLRQSSPAGATTQSFSGYTLGGSLAAGGAEALRAELEASWARNQLRRAGEVVSELPDLGAGFGGIGTEDTTHGRLTLRRQWTAYHLAAYSEWNRRESSAQGPRVSLDAWTNTLEAGTEALGLVLNAGITNVHEPAEQEVRYVAGSLRWAVWRPLRLLASYRADTRRLVLQPSLDGRWAEAGLEFGMGQLTLAARGFLSEERQLGGPKRTLRGLQWTLSRRFAGWLPFVSAPRRGGEVR